MTTIDEKTIYCAAIIDAVTYLSGMAKSRLCSLLSQVDGQHDALHFVLSKTGTNAIIGLAFDVENRPVLITSNNPAVRWFSAMKWGFVVLGKEKLQMHGSHIDIGDGVLIPSIILELPVCEKLRNNLSKHKHIGVGYSDKKRKVILTEHWCENIVF